MYYFTLEKFRELSLDRLSKIVDRDIFEVIKVVLAKKANGSKKYNFLKTIIDRRYNEIEVDIIEDYIDILVSNYSVAGAKTMYLSVHERDLRYF